MDTLQQINGYNQAINFGLAVLKKATESGNRVRIKYQVEVVRYNRFILMKGLLEKGFTLLEFKSFDEGRTNE